MNQPVVPIELENRVKLCYYFPKEKKHQYEFQHGHIMFDDMNALKLYCSRHRYAINMPSLIEKNCKKCDGTGRIGKEIKSGELMLCPKCLIKNFNKNILKLLKLARNA